MEKYDRLHKMVKSLNRSEKRYVKLFIRAFRADSNYLRLLEVVSSMKKYDATRMRQAMRGEKMLRQLSVLKHQLYELILRAMRLYHSRSNEENSLWNDLQSIRFLAGKGLLEEAGQLLDKTARRARDTEALAIQLELLRWKRKLAALQNYQNLDENALESMQQEALRISALLRDELMYDFLSARVFARFFARGKARDAREYRELTGLIEDGLLQEGRQPATFRAKYLYHNTLAFWYGQLDAYDKSLEHLQEISELMAANPGITGDMLVNYISVLNNRFICQCELGLGREAGKTLALMESLPALYPKKMTRQVQRMLFMHLFASRCYYFIQSGNIRACYEILPELIQGLEAYDLPDWYGLYFRYNIAYVYFIREEYGRSLEWIRQIYENFDDQSGQDLYAFARILELLNHYELDNRELLPYLLRSTYRFIRKRNRLFRVEQEVLRMIRALERIPDRESLIREFQILSQRLKQIAREDVFERQALQYIDLTGWLDAKIEGKPFVPGRRLAGSTVQAGE